MELKVGVLKGLVSLVASERDADSFCLFLYNILQGSHPSILVFLGGWICVIHGYDDIIEVQCIITIVTSIGVFKSSLDTHFRLLYG